MPGGIVELITALGIGALLTAIVGWLKDRQKIASDVKLTDMETLQKQLAYLEKVIENIGNHNDRLRKDLDDYEEREKKRIDRIRELETEVDTLRRGLRTMESQCERLSTRLAEFLAPEGDRQQ